MSQLFSIIAAIIHIGEIDFVEDHSDRHMTENSKVNNFQPLQISKYNVRLVWKTLKLLQIRLFSAIGIFFPCEATFPFISWALGWNLCRIY